MNEKEKKDLDCLVLKGKMINTLWDSEKQHYAPEHRKEAGKKYKKYVWNNVPIASYPNLLKDVYSRCDWKMYKAFEAYRNGK